MQPHSVFVKNELDNYLNVLFSGRIIMSAEYAVRNNWELEMAKNGHCPIIYEP